MAKQDERLDEFKENRLIKKKISYFIIKFKQTTGLMLMFALAEVQNSYCLTKITNHHTLAKIVEIGHLKMQIILGDKHMISWKILG